MPWTVTGISVGAGQTVAQVVTAEGMPCRSVLFVQVAGTDISVALSLQVSPNAGTTWFTLPFINLTGTNNATLADSVTIAAAATRAVAGLDWLPKGWQFRVTMVNGGSDAATMGLYLQAAEDDAD